LLPLYSPLSVWVFPEGVETKSVDTKVLFHIKPKSSEDMLVRENKISTGLMRLLTSEPEHHFKTSPEVFVENPANVNAYFELFSQAQLTEIANHD
jgi:hypothetical protein